MIVIMTRIKKEVDMMNYGLIIKEYDDLNLEPYSK
jgi:hypothetical protein